MKMWIDFWPNYKIVVWFLSWEDLLRRKWETLPSILAWESQYRGAWASYSPKGCESWHDPAWSMNDCQNFTVPGDELLIKLTIMNVASLPASTAASRLVNHCLLPFLQPSFSIIFFICCITGFELSLISDSSDLMCSFILFWIDNTILKVFCDTMPKLFAKN